MYNTHKKTQTPVWVQGLLMRLFSTSWKDENGGDDHTCHDGHSDRTCDNGRNGDGDRIGGDGHTCRNDLPCHNPGFQSSKIFQLLDGAEPGSPIPFFPYSWNQGIVHWRLC